MLKGPNFCIRGYCELVRQQSTMDNAGHTNIHRHVDSTTPKQILALTMCGRFIVVCLLCMGAESLLAERDSRPSLLTDCSLQEASSLDSRTHNARQRIRICMHAEGYWKIISERSFVYAARKCSGRPISKMRARKSNYSSYGNYGIAILNILFEDYFHKKHVNAKPYGKIRNDHVRLTACIAKGTK